MGNGEIFNAAKGGNWDEVKSLTVADSSFDCKAIAQKHDSSSLLHFAALQGNVDAVRWLVEEKSVPVDAYLNAQTRANDPLMIAAMYGHTEVVRFLVQHAPQDPILRAAYIDHEDFRSQTAVMHAAAGGHLEVVKILVEQGQAKLETIKPYPYGHYTEAKGAAWDKESRQTALQFAKENNREDVVQYLKAKSKGDDNTCILQ
jgi:ankyrin repeat protein